MADWEDLCRELDAWRDEKRTATFWWRDDDATRTTPDLVRLLAISADTRTPVALAVIPRDADDGLQERVSRHVLASVLQHGWSHENHAPEGDRQEEHGPHRPCEDMLAELARGRRRIAGFDRGLPVLVAPWNRIDPGLVPRLPDAGLHAVSTLGPRETAQAAPDVRRTNVHVDIMDWTGSGGFVGEAAALDQVLEHLTARRRGTADASEPTGIMTHHLFHDDGCWWFIEELVRRTRDHAAARWLGAQEAFWP